MKKLLIVLALFAGLVPSLASAATANITWSAPTTTTDGQPLTGINVVTAIKVWVSTSPIPAAPTAAPAVTITDGTKLTTSAPINAVVGQTVYAGVQYCNAAGCNTIATGSGILQPKLMPPGSITGVTVVINNP